MGQGQLPQGRNHSKRFWLLTTWAAIAILAGVVTGIVGFTRLARSSLAPQFGQTLLFLFVGTQVVLVGVVLYMYSLFEYQKLHPDRIQRVVSDYAQRLPENDPRRRDVMNWGESKWRHITPSVFIGQSLIILVLLAWLSTEYQSNLYMQNWVRSSFPALRVLLDPYFVALLTGIFVGGILIYFLQKRSREQRILEYLRRIE